MSMTNQQKGLIGEWEVAKLLMIGGRGALVVTIPMAIDAGHDLKVYERGRPSGGLALQVKVTTRLPRRSGHPFLQASFRAPLRPFVASPRLWFLFGHIDLRHHGKFSSPLFLIPAGMVRRRLRFRPRDHRWWFHFDGSMRSEWVGTWGPYRVKPEALAMTVLEMIRRLDGVPPRIARAPQSRRRGVQ